MRAGATMAFGFNLSNYFFVLLTSALTTTVAANGVKVVNIIISALRDGVSDTRNWIGVALVCASLCIFAYFSYMAKRGVPPSLQLPFVHKEFSSSTPDAKAAKPTEGTPLRIGKDRTSEGTSGAGMQCCVIC